MTLTEEKIQLLSPLSISSAASTKSQRQREQFPGESRTSPLRKRENIPTKSPTNNKDLQKKTPKGIENSPFKPTDQAMLERHLKTPTRKKEVDADDLNQSGMKSPLRTETPTQRNKAPVNRNVKFEDSLKSPNLRPKSPQTLKRSEEKPIISMNMEERTRSPAPPKQDEMISIYKQDYKEILLANFLKKDCPLFGLPKPPKRMEKGKTHFYYNEEENAWN